MTAGRFRFQKCFDVGILINNLRSVLGESAGIRSRTIGAVQLVAENAEIRDELSTVMRRMRDAANEDSGPDSRYIKERNSVLEPGFGHCFEFFQTL